MTTTKSKGRPSVYVPAFKPQVPSPNWARVKPEDIGSGFRVIEERVKDQQVYRNKFFKGRSRHILFFVKARKAELQDKPKPKAPVNLEYKLKTEDKLEFAQSLKRHQKAVSNLFVRELLPFTLAINTAVYEVRDKLKQITPDDVGLPIDFLMRKTLSAVELRILRLLIKTLNINKEEAALLMEEYISEKVKPKDRAPSQVPSRGPV